METRMRSLPLEHEEIVRTLTTTRSVHQTANALGLPETEVQRVAFLAFGLGVLDVPLVDF
jgi:hypothetical protein